MFRITPWNTALITVYAEATANLTSIGGPSRQAVIDGIVQEVNIKAGKVMFSGTARATSPTATAISRCPLPPARRGSYRSPTAGTRD